MDGLDLQAIADMVNGASSPEDAWLAFHAVLARNGLDRASLHVDLPRRAANPFAEHPSARIFGTFWDADLDARLRSFQCDVRQAEDRDLWHLRPTLRFLAVSHRPLFIDHRALLARQRDTPFVPISTAMLGMGQHQALVLPLSNPASPQMSTLNIWGDDPGPEFGQFVAARQEALQAAGLLFTAFLALRWRKPALPVTKPLSNRERQILSALAEGAQAEAIADRLGISERSTREYLGRARAKLGTRTRTETVARALILGLIDPARSRNK